MQRLHEHASEHGWRSALAALTAVVALAATGGCQVGAQDSSPAQRSQQPIGGGATGATGGAGGAAGGGGAGSSAESGLPQVRLATWNLHNFSKYGPAEFRITDIAEKIEEIDADVVAVQEIKVAEGSDGEGTQAWDVLLEELEDYDGLHNPYNTYDTTVGLLYDTSTTAVRYTQELFDDDSYAFPRPPLEAEITVSKGDAFVELTVIVLHLKAFSDAVDRRRAACAKLDAYLEQALPDAAVVLLGDLNDDPYDALDSNAFTGSFVDAEPSYHFLTHQLPPESVTSLGYYHWVNGTRVDGEFLDHIIVTSEVADLYGAPTPTIHSVPPSQYEQWDWTYSDHFPVIVDLEP